MSNLPPEQMTAHAGRVVGPTDLTPDIERVLSEHIRLVGRRDLREHCKCGWVSEDSPPFAAHRAHLAEQIAALVEQREETAGREALLKAAEELDSLGRGCSPEYATWLRDRAGGES